MKIRCIILIAGLLGAVYGHADSVRIGDLCYELDIIERTALVASESDKVTNYADLEDIVIPEQVVYNDYIFDVVGVAPRAFYYSKIKTVECSKSILTIGKEAFYNCRNLESVILNDGLESIGDKSFGACWSLTSIAIPGSCKVIGNQAFVYSSKLSKVTFGDGVETIGYSAFYICALDEVIIPSSVKNINGGAFTMNQGGTVVIESSSKAWGFIGRAFYGTDLNVYVGRNIPGSINSIFECSHYEKFEIGPSVTSLDLEQENMGLDENANSILNAKCFRIDDSREPLKLINVGESKHVIESLYLGRDVLWPTYESAPFSDNQHLSELTIGEYVTTLPDAIFSRCASLKSIKVPVSVETIGAHAFDYCIGLEKIVIGGNTTKIGEAAFANCSGLKTVVFEDGNNPLMLGVNTDEKATFFDCPLESLYLGRNLQYDSSAEGGYSPFYNKLHLTDVAISSTVTDLPQNIFLACMNLSTISIPGRVATIGKKAFGYTGLKNVVCEAIVPPALDYSFDAETKETASLYVPDGYVDIYQNTDEWRDFLNIRPMQEYDAITEVNIDREANVKVYSTVGVKIYDGALCDAHLPAGVYIIRYGRRSVKVKVAK